MPKETSRFSRGRLGGWAALAVLAGVVAAAGTVRSLPEAKGPAWPSTEVRAVRFAAVGDSITQGDSPGFSVGLTGSLSWVTYARSPLDLFAGGWAAGGATTARMAANVRPVRADVLVVIGGTNDLAQGVPFSVTAANIERIVATVGAPRVIVSAIPPRDSAQGATVAFNASLKELVLAHGWEWVDAPAGVREGEQYAPGMSHDGIHPSQAGAEAPGRALDAAISR
ncbi:SGNH/GDSL hydrolase family protein [Sinomonas susongensis]|uniref:SGNH/GDSL hydrolase family protein n=1 Tax=Sinomonas susongensis TaxID=1324851 RepID=UPI0011090D33|nr:SGNH/GDSL hydrolase family protein [Sinomonas susongensis]